MERKKRGVWRKSKLKKRVDEENTRREPLTASVHHGEKPVTQLAGQRKRPSRHLAKGHTTTTGEFFVRGKNDNFAIKVNFVLGKPRVL